MLSSATPTSIRSADGAIGLDDFYAVPSTSRFLYMPTRELWAGERINNILPAIPTGQNRNAKLVTIKPAIWLEQFRRAVQMTWAPGEPEIIEGKLISEGGWRDHPGARCLNLYIPPPPVIGDPRKAGPWLDHLRAIYPDDTEHFCDWSAFQLQRPGEKVNHALIMGGPPGIGKDSLLSPLRLAVGAWNFKDISPDDLAGPFNPHVKAKIPRIKDAVDRGEADPNIVGDRLAHHALASEPQDVPDSPSCTSCSLERGHRRRSGAGGWWRCCPSL